MRTLFTAFSTSVLVGAVLLNATASTAQPDSIFVDAATPDQTNQVFCPAQVSVRYNALRYASAQVSAAHKFTLPTDINPFGDLGQGAGTQAAIGGGGGGGNNLLTLTTSQEAVAAAIEATADAENAVGRLRKAVNDRAVAVQQLVVAGDNPNADLKSLVATAHTEAGKISMAQPTFLWPMAQITAAVKAVRYASSGNLTAPQKTVIADLQKEVTALQQAPDDLTNTTNLAIRSLIAWQAVLGNVKETDFALPAQSFACPGGAYADNATVSFVAIDRTLVRSSDAGSNPQKQSQSGSTPDKQSGQSGTPPQSSAGAFKRDLLIVVGPSRLTATHGIGFSSIPNSTWKTGTTLSGMSNVTQVQPDRQDTGRPFLMTTMVHYRLTPNPEPFALHASFAVTTSKQQIAGGMIGLSASLHQALYLSVGVFRADASELQGYTPYQIVPSGTTISTSTHAVNRIGWAISIPIFPGENGKSKTTPSTSGSDSPAPAKPKT